MKITKFNDLSRHSSTPKYTFMAASLHWVIAVLIIWGFGMGWFMTDIPGFTPAKLRYYSWHKWIGVTVLVLVLIRLLWRMKHQPPSLPDTTGRMSAMAAHAAHFFLYVLMFAVPVSGYFYTAVTGIPVVYLGLIHLPLLIAPHPEWRHIARDIHVWLDWTLAAVVVLHVLAVIKHMVIDRDRILARMFPFGD